MKQNSEVQSLKNQLNQLKQINENSKTEFTKLYSLLKARKEQCDTANHNLEQMRQEINKLFAQNTDLQNRLKQDTSEAQVVIHASRAHPPPPPPPPHHHHKASATATKPAILSEWDLAGSASFRGGDKEDAGLGPDNQNCALLSLLKWFSRSVNGSTPKTLSASGQGGGQWDWLVGRWPGFTSSNLVTMMTTVLLCSK